MGTDEELATARQGVLLKCAHRWPASGGAVFTEPSEAIRLATARLVDEGIIRIHEYEVFGLRKLGVRLTELGLQRLKT